MDAGSIGAEEAAAPPFYMGQRRSPIKHAVGTGYIGNAKINIIVYVIRGLLCWLNVNNWNQLLFKVRHKHSTCKLYIKFVVHSFIRSEIRDVFQNLKRRSGDVTLTMPHLGVFYHSLDKQNLATFHSQYLGLYQITQERTTAFSFFFTFLASTMTLSFTPGRYHGCLVGRISGTSLKFADQADK